MLELNQLCSSGVGRGGVSGFKPAEPENVVENDVISEGSTESNNSPQK